MNKINNRFPNQIYIASNFLRTFGIFRPNILKTVFYLPWELRSGKLKRDTRIFREKMRGKSLFDKQTFELLNAIRENPIKSTLIRICVTHFAHFQYFILYVSSEISIFFMIGFLLNL